MRAHGVLVMHSAPTNDPSDDFIVDDVAPLHGELIIPPGSAMTYGTDLNARDKASRQDWRPGRRIHAACGCRNPAWHHVWRRISRRCARRRDRHDRGAGRARSSAAPPGQGARHRDQLCGHGQRRARRLPARQSHMVVPVAQHHSLCQPVPPLSGAGFRRNGLVRQIADQILSLCRSRALHGCLVRGVAAHQECHAGRARLGSAHRLLSGSSHPGEIKAIAYIEAVILPRRWEDYTGGRDKRFRLLRSPEGEHLVLDENMFVEVSLPSGILRKLSDEEMEAYRAPYRDRDRRLPTLVWPRELPIEGEPADVVAIVDENAQWLAASSDAAEAFHQWRSWNEHQRARARVLPNLAQSARGHGQGIAPPAGGFAHGDR